MRTRFHHAAISTPDLDRSLSFYRDLLGFELVAAFAWPRGTGPANQVMGLADSSGKAVLLRLGEIKLEVFEFETAGTVATYGRDPDGNVFELLEERPGAAAGSSPNA
jgi:catechol 2,3-dioxygenase-like lactoylglutathione lyase family enzyme